MEEIDSAQFAEWKAFMSADPFLHERMDLLFASLQAFLESRLCGDPSSGSITLADYLCDPWASEHWEAKPPSVDLATLKSIFASLPGVVIGPPKGE
jgi:hypothetical protein